MGGGITDGFKETAGYLWVGQQQQRDRVTPTRETGREEEERRGKTERLVAQEGGGRLWYMVHSGW